MKIVAGTYPLSDMNEMVRLLDEFATCGVYIMPETSLAFKKGDNGVFDGEGPFNYGPSSFSTISQNCQCTIIGTRYVENVFEENPIFQLSQLVIFHNGIEYQGQYGVGINPQTHSMNDPVFKLRRVFHEYSVIGRICDNALKPYSGITYPPIFYHHEVADIIAIPSAGTTITTEEIYRTHAHSLRYNGAIIGTDGYTHSRYAIDKHGNNIGKKVELDKILLGQPQRILVAEINLPRIRPILNH